MNLDAVRTFVTAADAGRFQDAAAELSVTQQAVSKRVAGLEQDLGVRLFARAARGARLTVDGRAFLPHARALLQAEERAAASVRPGSRALRVDVIGRQLAPAGLLRDFHRAHPHTELDVVTLFDADEAIAAVRSHRNRVGRVLRRPRRGLRAHHRHDRPRLRHRTPAGRDRQLGGAGDAGRRADPARLARRARPAAHPPARTGPGLPALAGLARRQPAPGAHRTPRPSRHRAGRRSGSRGVGTAVGGRRDQRAAMTAQTMSWSWW